MALCVSLSLASLRIMCQTAALNTVKSNDFPSARSDPSSDPEIKKVVDLTFRSKGLYICYLNIKHIVPRMDGKIVQPYWTKKAEVNHYPSEKL